MGDPHRISTEAQLREVLDTPSPLVEGKVFAALDPVSTAFIERAPLVFVATCDAHGRMDVSPKGDAPGFVSVEGDAVLLVPDRPGNDLAFGHLNLLENPRISLIFVIPNVRETLRVNGRAELTRDPAVLAALPARGRPARLATRVFVEEVFFHCGKAMIRSGVWKPASWPERFKPGIGRQLAAKAGADDTAAAAIDEALERDYRENL